jgi:hypothetical protein
MTAPKRKAAPPKSRKWMPAVGETIVAYLPNESVRATVEKYEGDDVMIARLNKQAPLAKSHSFRFNQAVKLHRKPSPPMGERWEVEED